ncbi:MAG TPA: hypothetical protein VL330_05985 [Actinomycetes bacterium]|nr:hypothetical protein [Actinomycetes bacterium]
MKITIYGWSTDVERLVKRIVLPGGWQGLGAGEDQRWSRVIPGGMFISEVEEPVPAGGGRAP